MYHFITHHQWHFVCYASMLMWRNCMLCRTFTKTYVNRIDTKAWLFWPPKLSRTRFINYLVHTHTHYAQLNQSNYIVYLLLSFLLSQILNVILQFFNIFFCNSISFCKGCSEVNFACQSYRLLLVKFYQEGGWSTRTR